MIMIVGRISISFERGIKRNQKEDLGIVDEVIKVEEDGGILRGYGTHYKSKEAKEKAERLEDEDRKIRNIFKRTFPLSPIPGIFILPTKTAARELLDTLEIPDDLKVTAQVFTLNAEGGMDKDSMQEWSEKIHKQFKDIPLGREREIEVDGLDMIEKLASCPVIGSKAREEIFELVQRARDNKIERVAFRRQLSAIDLDLDGGEQVAASRTLVDSFEPAL